MANLSRCSPPILTNWVMEALITETAKNKSIKVWISCRDQVGNSVDGTTTAGRQPLFGQIPQEVQFKGRRHGKKLYGLHMHSEN